MYQYQLTAWLAAKMYRTCRKRLITMMVCAGAVFFLSSCKMPNKPLEPSSDFDFVVLADTAYTVPDDYPAYYQLIEHINQLAPAFTLHLGDTKSGGSDCGDEAQLQIKSDFQRITHPLIYTPGDNEWRDCQHKQAGGYDPLERLDYLRSVFFGQGVHLGQQPLAMESQSLPGIVENKLWEKNGVVFATLHIVGSNNGLPLSEEQEQQPLFEEYQTRNQANIAWLKAIFKRAQNENAKAVVLAFHGGMFPVLSDPDGFADMRSLMQKYGSEFGKPVLLVHGDHHSFIIDRPYGYSAPNIIRLQTFGAPESRAVRIHVKPNSEEVFSYAPVF